MKIIFSLVALFVGTSSLAATEIQSFSARVADVPEITVFVRSTGHGEYQATIHLIASKTYGGQNSCHENESCAPPPGRQTSWQPAECCKIMTPVRTVPVTDEYEQFTVQVESTLTTDHGTVAIFSDTETGHKFRASIPIKSIHQPTAPNCEISLEIGHASGNFNTVHCSVTAQ
jgi:hypothetical protein